MPEAPNAARDSRSLRGARPDVRVLGDLVAARPDVFDVADQEEVAAGPVAGEGDAIAAVEIVDLDAAVVPATVVPRHVDVDHAAVVEAQPQRLVAAVDAVDLAADEDGGAVARRDHRAFIEPIVRIGDDVAVARFVVAADPEVDPEPKRAVSLTAGIEIAHPERISAAIELHAITLALGCDPGHTTLDRDVAAIAVVIAMFIVAALIGDAYRRKQRTGVRERGRTEK